MSTEFTGSYLIPAPRERVWEALNDADILGRSIPGCEAFLANGPGAFRAKVAMRIGVINATFEGDVQLDPVAPPERFSLTGQASGGLAGFAKGGADITLTAVSPAETRLDYLAKADIGGRVAMVGGRLIQSVASRLADRFFAAFAAEVAGDGADARRLDAPERPAAPSGVAPAVPAAAPIATGAAPRMVPITIPLSFLAGIGVGIAATSAAVIALSVAS